jgi:GDPmannose 4,6-dehydratase
MFLSTKPVSASPEAVLRAAKSLAVNKRIALIIGATGQDGAYPARLLLRKGYAVHATSRDAALARVDGFATLGIRSNVTMHSMLPADERSVARVMEGVAPHEIYTLAGPSSVALSFSQPSEALGSIVLGTLNLLQALRQPRSKNPLLPGNRQLLLGGRQLLPDAGKLGPGPRQPRCAP